MWKLSEPELCHLCKPDTTPNLSYAICACLTPRTTDASHAPRSGVWTFGMRKCCGRWPAVNYSEPKKCPRALSNAAGAGRRILTPWLSCRIRLVGLGVKKPRVCARGIRRHSLLRLGVTFCGLVPAAFYACKCPKLQCASHCF